MELLRALKGGGRAHDQSIFTSSQGIRFHIMPILPPDPPLFCMMAKQDVTFLFRCPHNVWRTIGCWFFFCQSRGEAVSHYIISIRRVNTASLHTVLCQVNVPFLSGDGEGREGWGVEADSQMMALHPNTRCFQNKIKYKQ